jgi:butyrate kinase
LTPAVLTAVADLVEIAGKLPASRVAIAGGDRPDDLRLVEAARDHGIIDRILLIGRERGIRRAVAEVGIQIPAEDILPSDDDDSIATRTVQLVQAGDIDIVLKGNISTPTINRHMLALANRPTVSLASLFDAAPIADGRPMLLTDAGVTTVCNFGRLVGMIQNAVEVARIVMGIPRPRVAVLSANEKQVASLPSTWLGAALSRRQWPDAFVYGPLSFDLATDLKSVQIKGIPDLPAAKEVAGRADIIVCPGIDAANILYKSIAAMAKYGEASIAGITLGFPVPYVILSRSDTLSTRLDSIALCSVYAQRCLADKHIPGGSPAGESSTAGPIKKKDRKRVLVVNPRSTSLKLALFEGETCVAETEHPCRIPLETKPGEAPDTLRTLTNSVLEILGQWGGKVEAIAARGGFLPQPTEKLSSGTYTVAQLKGGKVHIAQDILAGVRDHPPRNHASNWAIPLAAELAAQLHVPAYTVDPVVVDEFSPQAEISGYAGITRRSLAHSLSVRAAGRRAADTIGLSLDQINLVVAHLGSGITVAALCQGKIVDNNIALLGGGPFTPQCTGQLPVGALIDLCYSNHFTKKLLIQELTKQGGLRSYLDEDDMRVIEQRIEAGDEAARSVVTAMVYQIAKEIGAMFVAAGSDVEAIVLTGGLVRSKMFRSELRQQIGRLAPILSFEGSLEMEALAAGVMEVLSGRVEARQYRLPEELRE